MQDELKFHVRALSRFIYFVTEEEDRFIVDLNQTLSKIKKRRLRVFNSAFGLLPVESLIENWRNHTHKEGPKETLNLQDALISIYNEDPQKDRSFYVFTDPEVVLKNDMAVRRLLNLAHQLRANDTIIKVVIFVGPRLAIPQKLQRYIEVVHDRGLTHDEIKESLVEICGKLEHDPPTESLVKACKGLTAFELDAAVSQSIIATKAMDGAPRLDPKYVTEFKRRQLKKTDLISYLDVSSCSFEQVGGVERFKRWADKTKASWTEEGQKFGLRPPKGVLLVGVWGCGKSISAKALGNAWRMPVVQLELGKLRQSGVGDSEANTYRAISLIESVAPCIVFVDEAEKSFGGAQSSSQSDAGTTGRMLGILSTWLQETKAPICLALTANKLDTLPVEFVRRTNERFFFDLPEESERVDILKIHLRANKQNPEDYSLASLAEDARQMVGSEIEQSIQAALIDSFHAGKPCLDSEILSAELKRRPRIVKTVADEVKALMDWVGYDPETREGIRAKFASDKREEFQAVDVG